MMTISPAGFPCHLKVKVYRDGEGLGVLRDPGRGEPHDFRWILSKTFFIPLFTMASSQLLLFVIVGKNEPLYEAEFHKLGGTSSGTSDSVTRQNYFVLHSALDLVDKASWTTNNMYLKVVDKINHQQVSTFLTAGNIKFMLLHGGKNEDSIKNFFNEVYELYVKLSMNPFYKYDTPITSKFFDTRVRAVARRYLS